MCASSALIVNWLFLLACFGTILSGRAEPDLCVCVWVGGEAGLGVSGGKDPSGGVKVQTSAKDELSQGISGTQQGHTIDKS